MSRYPEIEIEKVKLYPIDQRHSKVKLDFLGEPVKSGSSFKDWWDSLPKILAADDLKSVVNDIVAAKENKKPVIVMMGAHVIKVGLSPVIIDLMEGGFITALAMNGAGVIHDVELSQFGKTSEDVAANIADGTFGMAKETGEFINLAVKKGRTDELGFGEAVGRELVRNEAKNLNVSLLGQAYKMEIPITVHVALGTDIIHQQPSADGAAIGDLSLRDFRIFARLVSDIGNGGVVLNFGSAVVLPEVFLKALTVARNLGFVCDNFTTANFDMIQHYRPRVNVVQRPTLSGGKGYQITGHHELMIPLMAMAVKEASI
ncbi:hypothetical protein CEE37_14245 [candidate division LCP-89 bacterium B3_LCP]|uniref:Uncharacterized protein n=1 Tax=candidate division LCP-89 bacterium B3_LCP TaxID=2012998 RepID=A0A532UQQ2_UNCL8|nr:MAG: hypothetical protein CEE37_14245 [candidate division LCP-89 bacterium B3_LCP]